MFEIMVYISSGVRGDYALLRKVSASTKIIRPAIESNTLFALFANQREKPLSSAPMILGALLLSDCVAAVVALPWVPFLPGAALAV